MSNITNTGPAGLVRLIVRWASLAIPLRQLRSIVYLPRYLAQWRRYAAASPEQLQFRDSYPCLADWVPATPFDPHYFYQGAWLARRIAARRPASHVDVGSSILTISVLSAAVPTTFVDYRPLQVSLPNLECIAGDITDLPYSDASVASLSSMHVLEHIGLGRYGDPLDPAGTGKGAAELSRILAPGGVLYLAVPVGKQRTCFNAHRIFNPEQFTRLFPDLTLVSFAWVDDNGDLHMGAGLHDAADAEYGCGFFEFERSPHAGDVA